jgi:Cu-Zn family superoxide dismutase
MKKLAQFAVAASAAAFAVVLSAQAKPVIVALSDAAGKSVGTATISGTKTGVSIALNLNGLPAGAHAIHIHQTAKCEAPGFTTAGGHFNPDAKKHGLENPEGHHAGDMMNFTVKEDGTAKLTVTDDDVTLTDGPKSIFTGGGTALMIHAAADDMKSDPAGNAGARIACGTIIK